MTSSGHSDPVEPRKRRGFGPDIVALLPVYVMAGGLVSFVGWAADLPRLTDWEGTGISIQPNTTVAAMAAGAGLALLNLGWRFPAAVLGGFVALIGGSVIFEYLSGIDLGIDSALMYGRTWGRTGVLVPGRMGPPGAVSWTLVGIAIVFASRPVGRPSRGWTPALALITACISTLGLVGHLYGASTLYAMPTVTIIATQTGTFILAMSLGLIASVPEYGPMRLLVEGGPAGLFVRRILPAIVLVSILLGLLRVHGERAGLYDSAFGTAIRTVTEIVLFSGFLWWTGAAIGRHTRRRGEADQALRASQQHVLDTLENISDAFVTFDEEWRFTYVNSEAERLLGKSRQELAGKVVWDVFPEAIGGTAYCELHRVASERVSASFEDYNRVLRRWFGNKADPTPDGSVAVYFEDITARKDVEQELDMRRSQLERELADTKLLQAVSTELVVQTNSQRFYDMILDAAVGILRSDFASMQMVMPDHGPKGGLHLLAHRGFDPASAQRWEWVSHDTRSSCGEALRNGKRVVVPDIERCEFMDGTEEREAFLKAGIRASQSTPLVSRSGVMVGMISTHWKTAREPSERELRLLDVLARQAADLIDRHHAHRQREELLENEKAARSDAERAARLKDDFLATLSHELRTPLNAVIGWSEILKQDLQDPGKARVALEVIERNARLQLELITDLLDVSRIASGHMHIEMQAVDLDEVVEGAVESMAVAAETKGIRIENALERVPVRIHGDPARLQQVVWNLLSNAVKFTPRGGTVRVRLGKSGSHAVIQVSDDGVGISPQFMTHIFERFRQEDASPSRSHGGLGLGLAIVKKLTELHGGRVRAESGGPGQGATFVVELPLMPVVEETREILPSPPGRKAEPARRLLHPLGGIRVLLVDDEPDALVMMRRILEESGASVAAAPSTDVALELVAGGAFDVLVSDIGMPIRDGYELIREVRSLGIGTPAIALTAFARPDDRVKALEAGFQAHVPKPLQASDLLAVVASLTSPAAQARR